MFLQSVEFCGSVLEDGTRRTAPGKMAALQLWERPKTITQLRAFLGCCNYYHEFLPLYAKFSGPLTELLNVGKIEGKRDLKSSSSGRQYVKRPLLVSRKHWQMWLH